MYACRRVEFNHSIRRRVASVNIVRKTHKTTNGRQIQRTGRFERSHKAQAVPLLLSALFRMTFAQLLCFTVSIQAVTLPASAMTTQAYEAAVDKLFMNTQFNDAHDMCAKAIKENPKDKVIFLNKMGEMYIVATKGRSGLDSARQAARLAPKNAQVVATCAIVEFLAGYVVKAEQMAQEAVALDGKNGRAHAALALCGLRNEMLGTHEELAKAMKLAPRDVTVFIVAGIIHLRKLEYDQAEKAYSQFVKAFPNTALPYYQRGYFRREVFNNAGALRDLDEVIKHYGNDHYVRTTRAKLNKKTGRYKEAIDDFNALEKMSGAGNTSYSRRAECYEKVGNFEAAIKDYRKALDAYGVTKPNYDKKYAIAHAATRRSAWNKMMDSGDAVELSDTKSTWLKYILLLQKTGKNDEALSELVKFGKIFPGDLNSIYARHSLYKKTGRWVEALSDINFLISRNPNVAEYYASRADIYKHMDKPDKSAADLKRVQNLEKFGTPEGE